MDRKRLHRNKRAVDGGLESLERQSETGLGVKWEELMFKEGMLCLRTGNG